MEFLQKLLNNPKKSVLGILIFMSLLFSYLYFNTADAVEVEMGPTYTGEFNGGFGISFSERFKGKYDFGLTLLSEQDWGRHAVGNNANFWAAYVAKRPERFWKFLPNEFVIGPNVWIKSQSPINGCTLGFMMGLKYRIGHYSIGLRHWSNAGICKPNRGQEFLSFGYNFY